MYKFLTTLNANDVLLGRGTGPNENEGNRKFRLMAAEILKERGSAISETKRELATKLMDMVHARKGRFVRKLAKDERNAILRYDCKTEGASTSEGHRSITKTKTKEGQKVAELFVIVSDLVAIEKGVQTLRHQMRVIKTYPCSSATPPCGNDASSLRISKQNRNVQDMRDSTILFIATEIDNPAQMATPTQMTKKAHKPPARKTVAKQEESALREETPTDCFKPQMKITALDSVHEADNASLQTRLLKLNLVHAFPTMSLTALYGPSYWAKKQSSTLETPRTCESATIQLQREILGFSNEVEVPPMDRDVVRPSTSKDARTLQEQEGLNHLLLSANTQARLGVPDGHPSAAYMSATASSQSEMSHPLCQGTRGGVFSASHHFHFNHGRLPGYPRPLNQNDRGRRSQSIFSGEQKMWLTDNPQSFLMKQERASRNGHLRAQPGLSASDLILGYRAGVSSPSTNMLPFAGSLYTGLSSTTTSGSWDSNMFKQALLLRK